MILYTDPCHCY